MREKKERENQQRRKPNRNSAARHQSNRTDEERSGNLFDVNSVRQFRTNDRENRGSLVRNIRYDRALKIN